MLLRDPGRQATLTSPLSYGRASAFCLLHLFHSLRILSVCAFLSFSCSELRITKQLSRLGLRVPSSLSLRTQSDHGSPRESLSPASPTPPAEEPTTPVELPQIPHRVYGLYWLNDSSVAVILSDRFDVSKCRILAVRLVVFCNEKLTIHGGFDWLSLDVPPSCCAFQQVRESEAVNR